MVALAHQSLEGDECMHQSISQRIIIATLVIEPTHVPVQGHPYVKAKRGRPALPISSKPPSQVVPTIRVAEWHSSIASPQTTKVGTHMQDDPCLTLIAQHNMQQRFPLHATRACDTSWPGIVAHPRACHQQESTNCEHPARRVEWKTTPTLKRATRAPETPIEQQ